MRGVWRCAGLAALVVCTAAAASLPSQSGPRIQLGAFATPSAGIVGLIAKVQVNGGPAVRLLLDSGSQYMVLDHRTAAKLGLIGTTDLDLIGAGAAAATVAPMGQARTVQIGGLIFRDVPVLIADHTLADGLQGVIPLSLFAGYLIRLDVPRRTLELQPYLDRQPKPEGALPSYCSNRLLFVRGTVNETREGYFLLDTGASYTAISQNLARQLKVRDSLLERVSLQGGTASLSVPLVRSGIHLRFGSQELEPRPVAAVDLSTSSRYHQVEVSGLLGYPSLSDSVLTVSYRDRFILLDRR